MSSYSPGERDGIVNEPNSSDIPQIVSLMYMVASDIKDESSDITYPLISVLCACKFIWKKKNKAIAKMLKEYNISQIII